MYSGGLPHWDFDLTAGPAIAQPIRSSGGAVDSRLCPAASCTGNDCLAGHWQPDSDDGSTHPHTKGHTALASMDHDTDSNGRCPLATPGGTRHAAQSICLRLVPAWPGTGPGNRHDHWRRTLLCTLCPE